jgi:hypothetical protein
VPAGTISILTTDPRIASGENENVRRHQRGRRRLFSPASSVPNAAVLSHPELADPVVSEDLSDIEVSHFGSAAPKHG